MVCRAKLAPAAWTSPTMSRRRRSGSHCVRSSPPTDFQQPTDVSTATVCWSVGAPIVLVMRAWGMSPAACLVGSDPRPPLPASASRGRRVLSASVRVPPTDFQQLRAMRRCGGSCLLQAVIRRMCSGGATVQVLSAHTLRGPDRAVHVAFPDVGRSRHRPSGWDPRGVSATVGTG